MSLVWALGLVVVLLFCWATNLFGLPGNWLMLAATALYAYAGPKEEPAAISWQVVIALAVLAVLGEVVETLASAMGVKKLGGSRRSAIFALIGSIAGGLLGLMVGLPIPVIGPIVTGPIFAALGALGGAILGEQSLGRDPDQAWQIGKAAFWGRLLGTLAKVLLGSLMIAIAAVALVVPWNFSD